MSLFSFQGRIYLGDRTADGKPTKLQWVGNAPTCTLELSTESTTHKESFSGKRLTYGRLQTSIEANINLVLEELLAPVLIQALYARPVTIAAGTVTNEQLPADLVAGDVVKLEHGFLDAIPVITDSASSPVTLSNEQIETTSLSAGLLTVKDITGLTAPFKVAYGYVKRSTFAIFGQTPPERYLILDGINTETNEPVLMRAYRVKFDPTENLEFINEEYGQLSLNGSILLDNLNMSEDEDSELAGFADIQFKEAS